jgi:hypothetical protein
MSELRIVRNTVPAVDVVVVKPARFIEWYLDPPNVTRGPSYYRRSDVETGTDDAVGFADLAWAVLLEERPASRAAQSLLEATPVALPELSTSLHDTSRGERDEIANVLMALVALDGFASSVARDSSRFRTKADSLRSACSAIPPGTARSTTTTSSWRPKPSGWPACSCASSTGSNNDSRKHNTGRAPRRPARCATPSPTDAR